MLSWTPKLRRRRAAPLCWPHVAYLRWGEHLDAQQTQLAFKLLKVIHQDFADEGLKLLAIDLSHSNASSYGQREIVIVLENQFPRAENGSQLERSKRLYLRLNVDHVLQGFGNFRELLKSLKSEGKQLPLVVDLRVPHYAYLLQGG